MPPKRKSKTAPKSKFLTEKKIENFETPLKTVIEKMSLHSEHRLLGSGSLEHITYVSDYDLQNKLKSTKGVADAIKTLVKNIDEGENTWFIDLKAGEDTKTEKGMHWTYDEIMKEKKGSMTLQQAIDQSNTIFKLDVVIHIDGKFISVTEFYTKPTDHKMSRQELAESVANDMNEYIQDGNFFKSLKRLLSYLRLTKPNSKVIDALVAFFDSNVGLANAIKNDLEVMVELLDSKQRHKNVPMHLISETIQTLKQQLNSVFLIKISDSMFRQFDDVSKKPSSKKIQKIVDELKEEVNKYTYDFLKKNANVFNSEM
jgi:hypothetical protein